MTILPTGVLSESKVISTRFDWASNEFFTNSNTAMKSSVISSLPMMVLRAELILNLTLDISKNLLGGQAYKFSKQRRHGVADLRVARGFENAVFAAGGARPFELEPILE